METAKKSFKDGSLGPTVVLFIICLVVSGLLAVTYQVTKPAIEAINQQIADEARLAVLPGAESFTEKDVPEELKANIENYFIADNGTGVAITTKNKSFGGVITVMVGINSSGEITGIKITDHADTPGLGTKAQDPGYLEKQYYGRSSTNNAAKIKDDGEINAVTGATVSSNAIYGCVNYALDAYKTIGMGGK